MKRRTLLQASPLLFGLPELAQAQAAYPSKPIRYIVPVSAGGGSDMVGRALCERWAKVLGQSVVVDNIGGGGGVVDAGLALDSTFVKIVSWYDNEWGYSNKCLEMVRVISK